LVDLLEQNEYARHGRSHYGRSLPQDKSEIAARILNQVWEAA
jgi:hypothetical protein